LLAAQATVAARRWLARMDRLFSRNAHAVLSLALLLAEAGNRRAASAACRAVRALHPTQATAWFNLAHLLEQQEDCPATRRAFGEQRELSEAARIIRHLKGLEPTVAAQLEGEMGAAVLVPAGPGSAGKQR
jgi:tetratricopeptide (TPR) repeat protein